VVVAVWGGGSHKPAPRKEARPTAVAPSPPPEPRPVPPPPRPEKAPAPATVTISIDSSPAGAEVVDASGTVLGNTPFQGRFPAGDGLARLVLQKDGFRPKRLTVTLARDQTLAVMLERRPAPGRPRPPAPAKPREEDNDRRKL
jgi:hypothetical protein